MTREELLTAIARHRTREIVVTTMSVTRPWGLVSDHDLDFASADSAMGHAADLALGIALARPDRTVVCLNGDGSMLMSLGTLATIIGSGARNFVLFVVDNGAYEITGHQPVAASGRLDYAAMARAVGFETAVRFDDGGELAAAVPELLGGPGPTLVHVDVRCGTEGPISRSATEPSRYLQVSLADSARALRDAIAAT